MNGVQPKNKKVLLVSIQQTIMETLRILFEQGGQVTCKKIFQVNLTRVDTLTSSSSSLICIGFTAYYKLWEMSFARRREICIRVYLEFTSITLVLHHYYINIGSHF